MSGAEELMKEVHDLRTGGTLDDKTLETLRDEWKIEQVYETTRIEGNQSGSRRDTNGDHARDHDQWQAGERSSSGARPEGPGDPGPLRVWVM